MALPLPALTFQQTAVVSVAAPQAPSDVITAVVAAIGSLTGTDSNWTSAAAQGQDASNPAIRLIAPATSPVSVNAVFGRPNSTASLHRASYRDYTVAASVDSANDPGHMWLSIGPDGYDSGSAPTWYSSGTSSIYGTGKRDSGFWLATDHATQSAITQVWVIASAETLTLCFRYASDNNCCCVHLGAIIEGVNADNVEADDRLYGMVVPGGTQAGPMTLNWEYYGLSSNFNFCHIQDPNQSHAGVFDPTSAGAAEWATWSKRGWAQSPNYAAKSTQAFNGGLVSVPVQAWRVGVGTTSIPASDYNGFCGHLRGMYWTPTGTARSVLLNTSAQPKGYRMSGTLGLATYPAFVLQNGS